MINDNQSLTHTKWNCKYHIVFAPKYRRLVIYGTSHLKFKGVWYYAVICVRYARFFGNFPFFSVKASFASRLCRGEDMFPVALIK